MWKPISLPAIKEHMIDAENELQEDLKNLWDIIKIEPVKWTEPSYGSEGGGFWVVAICGQRIIWYNDIEEGFNISAYETYGQINSYFCNQDPLKVPLYHLFNLIKFGFDVIWQAGPPTDLSTDM